MFDSIYDYISTTMHSRSQTIKDYHSSGKIDPVYWICLFWPYFSERQAKDLSLYLVMWPFHLSLFFMWNFAATYIYINFYIFRFKKSSVCGPAPSSLLARDGWRNYARIIKYVRRGPPNFLADFGAAALNGADMPVSHSR